MLCLFAACWFLYQMFESNVFRPKTVQHLEAVPIGPNPKAKDNAKMQTETSDRDLVILLTNTKHTLLRQDQGL